MSATVLRELVARLGFEVDKKGFDQAERGVDGIRSAIRGADGKLRDVRGRFVGAGGAAAALGKKGKEAEAGLAATKAAAAGTNEMLLGLAKLAAAAGLTHLLKSFVDMASDANETTSALKEIFGAEGLREIQSWSDEMATTMGRSAYDLQAYAARLGAVIQPMVKNRELAQEMSTTLSGLAVDLGSFFNATDEDAMAALRSGLTGEYESLKRFGVVLNDATLQQYASEHALKKKVTTMSIAEKTQLRYNFILEASKTAQGDAARTGKGFANSTKALKAAFKDFATTMGMAVIPKLERLILNARAGVAKFKELTSNTNFLRSAMYTLAGVAAALAINLAAPFIVPALAIAGLVLLVDELNTLFSGGKTVIGEWLDKLGGVGTTDKLVRSLRENFETFNNDMPDFIGSWDLLAGSIDDVGYAIQRVMDEFVRLLTMPVRAPQQWVKSIDEKLFGWIKKIPGYKAGPLDNPVDRFEEDYARTGGRGMDARKAVGLGGEIAVRRAERNARIARETEERRAEYARARGQAKASEAQAKEDALSSRDPNEDTAAGMSVDPAAAAARVPFGQARVTAADSTVSAPWAPPVASPVGTGNMTVNVGGTAITINGGDKSEVTRIVKETMQAERRKTAAAIASMPGGS